MRGMEWCRAATRPTPLENDGARTRVEADRTGQRARRSISEAQFSGHRAHTELEAIV